MKKENKQLHSCKMGIKIHTEIFLKECTVKKKKDVSVMARLCSELKFLI